MALPRWKLSAEGQRKLRGCLIVIWKDGRNNAAIPVNAVSPPYRILKHEGRHITLREVGLKAEEDMIAHLRSDEKLGDIFSKREVERRIQDVVWKLSVATPETVEELATQAVDALQNSLSENPTDWTLLLPISNLSLDATFSLGRSTFHPFSQIDTLIKRVEEVLKRDSPSLGSMRKDFEGSSIAEARVTCVDLDQAKILAERDVMDALCAIRCLAAPAYRPDNKYVDFKGKIWAGTVDYTAFSSNDVQQGFSHVGYLIPMRLRSKYAQDPIVIKLDALLRKNAAHRTEIETRLVTAIRTFGLALNETTERDCFVTTIAALEALMIEDRDPKKETLAERTAHLIGTNSRNKRDIYKRMKDLYAIRSYLVHGEERNISETDGRELIEIAQACILRTLDMTDKLPSSGDFIAWFQEQKFPL